MNRRRFLNTAALAAGGYVIGCGTPHFAKTPAVGRIKNWVWIPTDPQATDEAWRRRFGHWRAHGLDAILPEVFNGRRAFYASDHLPVSSFWLERILPLASEAGLEVHAWITTMTCNIEAVHDSHPEWFNVNRNGDSSWDRPAYIDVYRFLCPSRPGVHAFLKSRVAELSRYERLDGIHLDVIRYPDVVLAPGLQPNYGIVQDAEYPEYDYCYCEVCRSDFKRAYGEDPLEMDDPTASAAWRQFRYDRITRIVNEMLVPIVRGAGKFTSAAVFPNWEDVRQQWSRWNVDGAQAMLYHSFYLEDVDWIGEQVRAGVDRSERDVPIYAGLLAEALQPQAFERAIDVALEAKASGVCLFSSKSMTDEHWQILRGASAV